ncbi:SCO family protein [Aliifodinibius sp. S!AR15-10]|uniref:SCO family protein n=1 Tax=Aliifodinibius sp. S!AR15-10 TaxID=2950437 RepID=UPI002866E6BB|nr:SCO family protein [Aliifodinibius sp. S!AR15-10]MDR8391237.1 SCO family protein [Aliifodinibius sp. S!AR15-10]
MNFHTSSILYPLLILFLASCNQPEVIKDLSDQSFQVLDQDSTSVTFPDDFEGEVTVLGFIYTNCPDVCPAITANMNNVKNQLESTENVHFVGISFDPRRDTPSVLKNYMQQFKLDEEEFTFLTGDTTTVDSLLSSLDITADVSYTKTSDEGKELYFMKHTNRISLMDRQGRLRLEYSGSFSKPEHIVEGINQLR